MPYDPLKHERFAERARNVVRAFKDIKIELQKLDDVYTSEAASGSDPDFAATTEYSKQELVNVISLNRDLDAFLNNGTLTPSFRSVWINPFIL
jgi:hypothetical protein